MALAMNRDREALAENEKWLAEYPIRDMIKFDWIKAGRDKASRLKALMNFLGVAVVEPTAYQKAVGFGLRRQHDRKSPSEP